MKQIQSLLLLILFFLNGYSQKLGDYKLIKHLTVEDGLPSNYVYSVVKDSYGFIWLATDQGVVKYDGEKIKVFTTEDGLPTNDIFDLREDKWGRIWMFCKCENLSYIKKDLVYNTASKHDNFYAFDFQQDSLGIIFNGNSGYTIEFDDSLTLSSLDPKIGEALSPHILERDFLLEKHYDNYDTLVFYSLSNGIIKPILEMNGDDLTGYNNRFYFSENNYIGAYNSISDHLLYFDKQGSSFTKIKINKTKKNQSQPTKLKANKMGFQLVTGGVFYDLHPVENSLFELEFNPLEYCDQPSSYHKEKNLLIFTSLDHGVFILKKNLQIKATSKKITGCSSYQIFRDSLVIVGDNEGTISILNSDLSILLQHKESSSNYDSKIRYLNHISDNSFFRYSISDGLQKFNLHFITDTVPILVSKEALTEKRRSYNKILLNSSDTIIVSASSYMAVAGLKKKKLSSHSHIGKSFREVTYGPKNDLYLGRNKSFTIYNIKTEEEQVFPLTYNVNKIQYSHSGLFFGTDGQGLFKFNIDKNESTNILADKSILDIKEDEKNLFLSTTDGAYFIENEAPYPILKYYSEIEGLYSNKVTFTDNFFGRDMIITDSGIQLFDSDYTLSKPQVELYIDHPQLIYKDTMQLNDSRDFSFSISKKDYLDYPIAYYVSFTKGKEDFTYTPTDNLTLRNLDPGTYNLEVYGENRDYNYTTNIITKIVVVTPKFYETLIFKFVGILALVGFIFMIFRLRFNFVRKRSENIFLLEKEYAGIELQALQSQMNPHFIFNCLNSIQALISEGNRQEASEYLIKFSRLMRSFLEQSSSNITTLQKEIDINRTYLDLEQLRFKNELTYSIEIDESLQNQEIEIPAVIVQPFVENAIRHGIFHKNSSGHIGIKIKEENDYIDIEILDDGIGIQEANKLNAISRLNHESKGTQIIKRKAELIELAENIKLNITIYDRKPIDGKSGTLVKILIPIRNS